MPSQEDYLDKLLKNLEKGAEEENTEPEETDEEPEVEISETEPAVSEAEAVLAEAALEELETESADLDGVMPDLAAEATLPELETDVADLDAILPELEEEAIESGPSTDELPAAGDVQGTQEPEAAESAETVDESVTEDVEAEVSIADLESAMADLGGTEPETAADLGLTEDSAVGDSILEEAVSHQDLAEEAVKVDSVPEDASVEPEIEDVSDMEGLLDSDDGLAADDNLSQDIAEEGTLEEAVSEDKDLFQAASDLDALSSMSEDDIERLLSAGDGESDPVSEELEEDVLGMLEDADDGDLQEIHQLLDRADNNEAVNDDIEALLQETPPEEDLEEKLFAEDSEPTDPKAAKAQEKERKRQEKEAAKKAAKEAKAAAKEARAAAKKGNAAPASEEDEKMPEETTAADTDDLFDTAVLDSIVSGADLAGEDTTIDQALKGGSGEEDLPGGGDARDVSGGSAAGSSDSEVSDDDLEFNMDSLFGDSDDSGLGSGGSAAGESGDSAAGGSGDFPDFVALDEKDVDSIVSNLDEREKKKKGLLARLFDFFTEEDEEEESEELQLSDENREILNDLEKEKTSGKKKKKGKKAAAKDGKDDKGKGKAKKEKKPKKAKPEKPKKEKKPEPQPLIPERRLSMKRMLPVFLMCASLAVLIIVFANASVDFTTRSAAREAYFSGDYQTCYRNYYGRDLSEEEQIMFGTSESILRIRLWLSEYEMFVDSDSELEALDVLIQSVDDYPELYEYAVKWNAGGEIQTIYQHLLNILAEKYGLTESQALEIAHARSDIEYTRMVLYIVEGRGFGSWNRNAPVADTPQEPEVAPLPDELPEEGELGGNSFIDNK